MKEKDGFIDYPEQQMILYVEKENGEYGPMQTGSFISANYMDDYVYKRRNLESGLREQVTKGIISPVRYYMVLEDLTVSELAARTGIRKSRVRKHLIPEKFGKATVGELSRYANVFNIPAANLLQFVMITHQGTSTPNLILENKAGWVSVTHSPTDHPGVVLTHIEERR